LLRTAVDRKTLAWIKEGVDETLNSIQEAPNQFAENPEDTTPIESCIAPLHRVKGAVEMVNIHGAMLLALELENLALAITEQRVKQKDQAAEVLATGMLQLPGYLESLYHGQPDMPLILLPLLNDLRAVQDKELLTEGEFFAPDLSIDVELESDGECIVEGALPEVARKLRPGYLSGLLGVIKEQDATENLEKLILVVDNLLLASARVKVKQLWWVALGVIESLYEKGLETSVTVKILLGRVDQQIQKVIENGEDWLADNPPDNIIKNLLYYLAQSQARNTRVVALKKAFGLSYVDETAVKKARENLYGFNVNLIETISAQVNEELTNIKESLDIAMHAKAGATTGLGPILEKLTTVADALGMLGMTRPKDLVKEQQDFLAPKIQQGEVLSVDDLMGVASAILQVESSLSDLGVAMDISHSETSLPPAEYDKLLKLVAQEVINDIKIIKQTINEYSLEPVKTELLHNVPQLLSHITGAMQVLRFQQLANLSQAISEFISDQLLEKKVAANEASLDLLADAITGLENYYQTILEESVAPEIGLQVATQSITKLGYAPKQIQPEYPLESDSSTQQYNYAG
jgi:chemosensory pili system protein ChpA (sensor histidine kinase/response regulator)